MTTETGRRSDRQALEILELDESLRLIDEAIIGRIAFVTNDQPIILPINHVREGMTIAFRSASGSKLDAALRAARVAFEVDAWDADARTGWSVLATGTAELADEITVSHLEALSHEPWATGVPRNHWIVIRLHNVSGRQIPAPKATDQAKEH